LAERAHDGPAQPRQLALHRAGVAAEFGQVRVGGVIGFDRDLPARDGLAQMTRVTSVPPCSRASPPPVAQPASEQDKRRSEARRKTAFIRYPRR
jgi:hypothetical protein